MSVKHNKQTDTLASIGEDGLIDALSRRLPASDANVILGIGDDAAILAPGAADVVTVDLLVENTHFDLDTIGSPEILGRKAITANASDIAAMGATPTVFVVGIAAPPETPVDFVSALYSGMLWAAERYGATCAGGDTTRGDALTISITMFGKLEGDAPAVRRDNARPGQNVFVTGWPGDSAAGLMLLNVTKRSRYSNVGGKQLIRRHQSPTARVEFGRFIRELARDDLAMIDLSDGISADANRLAAASGVNITILESRLPVSEYLERLRDDPDESLAKFTVHGGEDYELLFTTSLSIEEIRTAMKTSGVRLPVHNIGIVSRGSGVKLLGLNRRRRVLKPRGFKHFS